MLSYEKAYIFLFQSFGCLAGVKDTTKRMIQALQLIQKKSSPNEIEQETGLSPETVEKMLETLHINS